MCFFGLSVTLDVAEGLLSIVVTGAPPTSPSYNTRVKWSVTQKFGLKLIYFTPIWKQYKS